VSRPRVEVARTSLRPGEDVSGVIQWELTEAPTSAEVRLAWTTRGEGKPDREVVHVVSVADLPCVQAGAPYRDAAQGPAGPSELRPREQRAFSFRMPDQPYSFSGSLISLVWLLELAVEPDGLADPVELTLSSSGKVIELESMRSGSG